MKTQQPLRVIGAMSGTSLDGVDAAVVRTDGHRIFEFGPSAYRAYSTEQQQVLARALGCWPGEDGVAEAAEVVEQAHIEALRALQPADLVGFHGQTLAHDPGGRGTHQVGDGAALVRALDCPVVWDFRTEDVTAGGQGAPLAPFFHFACAQWANETGPVAFLNLGGVGNLTWVDPLAEAPDAPGALLAFDTGPANAPINDLVLARTGAIYDKGGALAATGTVDEAVVQWFSALPYFATRPPKSLDRNDFARLQDKVAALSVPDAVATLTACAVQAVALGAQHFPAPVSKLLVCGGGRHNATMMRLLADGLSWPVLPVEAIGLDGDMLEAQAFAYLAVRVLRGLPTSAPSTTGVPQPTCGGRISYSG